MEQRRSKFEFFSFQQLPMTYQLTFTTACKNESHGDLEHGPKQFWFYRLIILNNIMELKMNISLAIWNVFIWIIETFIASRWQQSTPGKNLDVKEATWKSNPFAFHTRSGVNKQSKSYSKPSRSTRATIGESSLSVSNGSMERAMKCFGISGIESLRQESLRKQFLKLSRLHHPDRNDNSSESIEKMQVINDAYEVLQSELNNRLRRQTANSPVSQSSPSSKHTSKSYLAESLIRRRSKRTGSELLKEQELAEINELEKKWRKNQKREMRARRKLHLSYERAGLKTATGRAAAYKNWLESIKDYKTSSRMRRDNGFAQPSKPQNLILEYSSHPIAVALRMGNSHLGINLVSDRVKRGKTKWRRYRFSSTSSLLQDRGVHSMDDSLRDLILREALLRPLDADGNHALHYAVYYEQIEMLQFLSNTARHFNRLEALVSSKNHRGGSAQDFSVCSRSKQFFLQMQQLCAEVATVQEPQLTNKQADPYEHKVSFQPAFYTVGGVLAGSMLFGCGWISSLVIVAATSKSSQIRHTSNNSCTSCTGLNRHMLEAHAFWYLIKRTVEICCRLASGRMFLLPACCCLLMTLAILPTCCSDWILRHLLLPIVNVYFTAISWLSYYAIPLEAKRCYPWKEAALLLAIKALWTKLIV